MGGKTIWGWRRGACLAAGVLLASAWGGPLLAASPGPLGRWARDDGGTDIEITQCGQDYCAVNIWVRDPKGAEKRGDKLVMTLLPAGASGAWQGRAYDVRRARHYAMTLTLAGSHMTTKGCVMFGVICKSVQWHRMD